MQSLFSVLDSLFWFVVILTIVVFIHELGHYIVARINNVKISAFSIGFGTELYGFTDKHGTRWKFCLFPFGGYVQMFGDADPASSGKAEELDNATEEMKERSFYFKTLKQKFCIVLAGPMFNYLTAILIIFFLSYSFGKIVTDPVITYVAPDSAAQRAGIINGDRILEIDNSNIESFEDIRQIIMLNTGAPLEMKLQRKDEEVLISLVPDLKLVKDAFGNDVEVPIIGISSDKRSVQDLTITSAFVESLDQVYSISVGMLKSLGQIIFGQRNFDQLGGPIKIAKYSGQSAKSGFYAVLWFIALISINLGLINLFPFPLLDGGHLAGYIIQGIRGKPMPEKLSNIVMQAAFAMLVLLMISVTINDILQM